MELPRGPRCGLLSLCLSRYCAQRSWR